MKKLHYEVSPGARLQGELDVPGDKSISHRAVILSAIANGTTTVRGFLEGEDCLATLRAFQRMGVRFEGPVDGRLVIHGVGKHGLSACDGLLDCGNSGTSIRLLAGLLSGQVFDSHLTGDHSLLKRPMGRILRPLTQMGANIDGKDDRPPLHIKGGSHLQGIHYEMPIASAQVKSCLLLAGLYAEGETSLLERGVTRDHTERMLTSFSYPLKKSGNSVSLLGGGELEACDISVPGDISSAAFFMVAASICPDADLVLRNVGINPTRVGILNILKAMGADIRLFNKRLCGDEPVADLRVQYAALEGIVVPAEWVPLAIDEFPVLFIAAACAKGQTIIKGAKELRFKESDRIASMISGLSTLGIETQALDDGVIIEGGSFLGGQVDSFSDHRVAMAFTVAACVASAPIKVTNCANVATSFPNFLSLARSVGINIRETQDD